MILYFLLRRLIAKTFPSLVNGCAAKKCRCDLFFPASLLAEQTKKHIPGPTKKAWLLERVYFDIFSSLLPKREAVLVPSALLHP